MSDPSQLSKPETDDARDRQTIVEIIAERLPTWMDLYRHPPQQTPTMHRLREAAKTIVAALKTEGYEIRTIPAQAVTRISIPTHTMEQEFAVHYRRGFEAGKVSVSAQTTSSALRDRGERKTILMYEDALGRIIAQDQHEQQICIKADSAGNDYEVRMLDGSCAKIARKALAKSAAVPPQHSQQELGSSERLGPQYDGTRSINSSSMVARHHEPDASGPGASSPQESPDLHDFVTHRDSWRSALERARDVAGTDGNNDDALYWEHEIKAFNSAFDTLAGILPFPSGLSQEVTTIPRPPCPVCGLKISTDSERVVEVCAGPGKCPRLQEESRS